MNVIDRRLNPSGKSLPNRQRFLRIAREAIRDLAVRQIRERSIEDVEKAGEVKIPMRRVAEPRLRHAESGGDRDHVLPGNRTFTPGDQIDKPKGGGGQGGSKASEDGSGDDEFVFTLTREEYLEILFEELELPDLAKTELRTLEKFGLQRAGHASTGSPSNLNLVRTMRKSLARRICLGRPTLAEVHALRAEAGVETAAADEAGDPAEDSEPAAVKPVDADAEAARAAALAKLRQVETRMRRISFIDPIDLRYNRFTPTPKPSAQAVMFCLMDVSGSMTEDMKDLAKRFFLLLHLFLTRSYKNLDIVFIRHTSTASEVDEETFFRSRETGGTVVSSALIEMRRIIAERYPPDQWNIYAAQASDGDNYSSDSQKCLEVLSKDILPLCQYFAYVEVYDQRTREIFSSRENVSDLWKDYEKGPAKAPNFAMKRVFSKADVFPVFHQLFARNRAAA